MVGEGMAASAFVQPPSWLSSWLLFVFCFGLMFFTLKLSLTSLKLAILFVQKSLVYLRSCLLRCLYGLFSRQDINPEYIFLLCPLVYLVGVDTYFEVRIYISLFRHSSSLKLFSLCGLFVSAAPLLFINN